MHVTVINPDDPHGPPAYEGPADQAHLKLAPGGYETTDPGVGVLVGPIASTAVPLFDVDIDRVHH